MDRISALKELGAKIRTLRQLKGKTQTGLASDCSLDRNYIGMLERGERNPTYMTLLAVAEGLSIDIAELISFKE